MCAACAMVVATAASGARAGLRAYLTPRLLKAATIALCVVALLGGSVALGGGAPAPEQPATAVR